MVALTLFRKYIFYWFGNTMTFSIGLGTLFSWLFSMPLSEMMSNHPRSAFILPFANQIFGSKIWQESTLFPYIRLTFCITVPVQMALAVIVMVGMAVAVAGGSCQADDHVLIQMNQDRGDRRG